MRRFRCSWSASERSAAARCPPGCQRRPTKKSIRRPRSSSRLDRAGLQKIAAVGGGQYFELDRDGDRHIANTIIDAAKRRAPSIGVTEQAEELYWRFLVVAALFMFAGAFFQREQSALWIQLAGGAIVLVILSTIIG